MVTTDIFRIALIVLFVLFALWSRSSISVTNSKKLISNPAETDDTESEQLLLRLQEIRNNVKQEPLISGNKKALREIRDFSSGVYFSASGVLMLIVLLEILF